MTVARWAPGALVVRREVLGLGLGFRTGDDAPPWLHRPWAAIAVHVVEHTADTLVTYLPEAAELGVADGEWPTADGRHPWHGRRHWQGHGVLMLHRRGDPYSVWHFWTGPDRAFAGWYVNLQAPYVETRIGFDTQDFELDVVVAPDRSWTLKDDELLDQRVAEGRFGADHATWIRSVARQLTDQFDRGHLPWATTWTDWAPPPDWRDSRLPIGWEQP